MPTFTVYHRDQHLSLAQKTAIAGILSNIHNTENGVPTWCAQTVFISMPEGDHFVGTKPVSSEHIFIRADNRPGRTMEKKTRMIERMVAEVSDAVGIDVSHIWVYINEVSVIAEYGMLYPPPGQEAEWVAKVPEDVKMRYQ